MVDPVAAPPLPRLARRLARAAARLLAAMVLIAGLYLLAGWIGSSLPRNRDWREPAGGVTILVESNGTHTGLVLPLVTPEKDWRESFPAVMAVHGGEATHVAIGWGEREVFLHVEYWRDLTPLTVLHILTTGGDSVLRVSPYVRPAPDAFHRPLRLTHAQYALIVHQIEARIASPRAMVGTDPYSLYYPARGRYTMFDNCNSWTGDVLAAAGVRTGWWTPFAGGVMKWVDLPEGS